MKKRNGDPWMPAPRYSGSLSGISLNLLVADVARSVAFANAVLGAETVYADEDFAVLRNAAGEWMVHADHTYDAHPMLRGVGDTRRGAGVELRLHGIDPDAAEAAARAAGCSVLASATDKGHGLREAYLIDPDGYTWVPDVLVPAR
jgi:catechol 2,3-dioxygenase-like lactoylglutathione lyase family enzyme